MSRVSIVNERSLAPPQRQIAADLRVDTARPGFTDITSAIEGWLRRNDVADGIVTVFVQHTSASLTIQENADPDVRADLVDAFDSLAPRGRHWRHSTEGPDDMPAHVKAALSDTSLAIPVSRGRMVLGTWQSIYLFEHRDRPHSRIVSLHYCGS